VGLRLPEAESKQKDFRVKIGGRTQVDSVAFSATNGPNQFPTQGGLDPELNDTVNFRRARLRIEGRMYEFYDWAAEYDFVNQINVNNSDYPTERDAGPLTAVTDLWLQLREIPILGTVRVGNQKDPYGYEHLTSSRWLNFMERSFAQDAFEGPFNNGFLPGIQVLNSNEEGDIAWQVGEFKNTTNPFGYSSSSGGSMTVGRFVWLPFYEDEGRKLMHLAVSGRTMEPRAQYPSFDANGLPTSPQIRSVRFRSRGSLRNGPPRAAQLDLRRHRPARGDLAEHDRPGVRGQQRPVVVPVGILRLLALQRPDDRCRPAEHQRLPARPRHSRRHRLLPGRLRGGALLPDR